jgi:hypothetical protein
MDDDLAVAGGAIGWIRGGGKSKSRSPSGDDNQKGDGKGKSKGKSKCKSKNKCGGLSTASRDETARLRSR